VSNHYPRYVLVKEQKKLFVPQQTLDNRQILVTNPQFNIDSKNEEEKKLRQKQFEAQSQARIKPGQTDLKGNLIKIQTVLPNFDDKLDYTTGWKGVEPVQQVSAQPIEHESNYLQGKYPPEYWSMVGNDFDATKYHGSSRHRVNDEGNYLAVGLRGKQPVGDLPKRGPWKPVKGQAGEYPQDRGVRVVNEGDMPSPKNIVVARKKAHENRFREKPKPPKRKVKSRRGGFRRGGKGIKVKKMVLIKEAPQYVLQDAHLPHKPFPDLPEGMPPQNVAIFEEHWAGEEGGAPPEGFHERYNLHPDAKVSVYGIGENTTRDWKPGTDQLKHIDNAYADQFNYKLPNISPDTTHVIANTGHSYPIGATLPQGSNINDVQQQQEGFPDSQARWDRQRPSYEAMSQQKLTGEPMEVAMRLLKGANDPPYDPDNPYWKQKNWKNYIDPDPPGAFGIPQSVWDDVAARQEEEGNKVDTPVETAMKVFNPRTENIYDSPDTHCELHGERLEPIPAGGVRQYPKGADENMYCTACEQNITNQPRQPQQFDIDEETQQKLTGEPMNIAMRLLKHAETPAAKKHKKEYDTKYESTPERREYRRKLSEERRKHGLMGHGGPDMSHTTGGKIVVEDMHANRARHFKERGTLKKMVRVIKSPHSSPSSI